MLVARTEQEKDRSLLRGLDRPVVVAQYESGVLYLRCLEPLGSLGDLERNPLALLEALVAVLLDLREVDKNVVTLFALDKAKALLVAEPLYCAFWHLRSSYMTRPAGRSRAGLFPTAAKAYRKPATVSSK